MSKIEVFCRYRKQPSDLTDEDKAYLNAQRIIHGTDSIEDIEAEDEKYEYGGMVLDMNDIKAFNGVDKVHTCLRFYEGDSFVIKAPYESFKQLYEELTGKYIRTVKWEEADV